MDRPHSLASCLTGAGAGGGERTRAADEEKVSRDEQEEMRGTSLPPKTPLVHLLGFVRRRWKKDGIARLNRRGCGIESAGFGVERKINDSDGRPWDSAAS